ncbi:MAG: class I SAM-dependent methyltransferase [Byssovorax sp.]
MALSILGHPAAYILSQRAVGAHLARDMALEALEPTVGQRVLDIGCGPAYYFDRLPRCDYFGFDTDAAYIADAQRRFGDRARFFAEPYTEDRRKTLPPIDRIMLMGLLHHLDDAACEGLLDLVARSLAPRGRVVTLDTVLFEGQSALARLLAKNDRGDFIRYPEGFLALARRRFASVEHRILGGDTWRMPSSHFLMVLAEPR